MTYYNLKYPNDLSPSVKSLDPNDRWTPGIPGVLQLHQPIHQNAIQTLWRRRRSGGDTESTMDTVWM